MKIIGTSKRTRRTHTGTFFEVSIMRGGRIYVRLDGPDGEIVNVARSMRAAIAELPSGLADLNILDRVTVEWSHQGVTRSVTGEIHSPAFERPGCGRGIMLKSDGSQMSTWMPLPEGCAIRPAN